MVFAVTVEGAVNMVPVQWVPLPPELLTGPECCSWPVSMLAAMFLEVCHEIGATAGAAAGLGRGPRLGGIPMPAQFAATVGAIQFPCVSFMRKLTSWWCETISKWAVIFLPPPCWAVYEPSCCSDSGRQNFLIPSTIRDIQWPQSIQRHYALFFHKLNKIKFSCVNVPQKQ